MTGAARSHFFRLLHLMNRTDSIHILGFAPSEIFIFRVPLRCDGVKVAGTAHHTCMRVMGCFFFMGPMTLFAISNRLVVVAEFHAPWMADHAGNIRMGG